MYEEQASSSFKARVLNEAGSHLLGQENPDPSLGHARLFLLKTYSLSHEILCVRLLLYCLERIIAGMVYEAATT